MKKVVKYILWLPFAVSISSFALYFVYAIRIKFKNLTVTENVDLIKHLSKCPKCRQQLLYYYHQLQYSL